MSGDIENLKISDSISQNKVQELNDLLMLVKKERFNFIKSDIFLDTILEASVPSFGINSILGIKIKDIILRGELLNTLRVKDEHIASEMALLDLDEFNNIELTYEEQKELKIALEQRIKEKSDEYLKDLNALCDLETDNLADVVNTIKFDTETEKDTLISWQRNLTSLQQLYINNLQNLGSQIQELLDVKYDRVPKITEQKSNEIEVTAEKFDLRLKLMQHQLHVSIFKELPISLDAYRNALVSLKRQQADCLKDTEILRNDIENYKIVSKKEEYQEVLKEFKQYKKSLEKKLLIYEFPKNTS